MASEVKKYVLVGAGNRGLAMFAVPLAKDFPERAVLAALCDPNAKRVAAAADNLPIDVQTFTDFEKMMAVVDPDGVVVAKRISARMSSGPVPTVQTNLVPPASIPPYRLRINTLHGLYIQHFK